MSDHFSIGSVIISLSTNDVLRSSSSCKDFLSCLRFLICVSKSWVCHFKHKKSSLSFDLSSLFFYSRFSFLSSFKLLICSSNLWLRFLRHDIFSCFSVNLSLRCWFSCYEFSFPCFLSFDFLIFTTKFWLWFFNRDISSSHSSKSVSISCFFVF